jgi:cold shock CspA family protein
MKATVKQFDEARGFGWLLPDDSSEAVFIHAAQLRESAPRLFALRAGQRVDFEVRSSSRKPGMTEAHSVRVIGALGDASPRLGPVRFGETP